MEKNKVVCPKCQHKFDAEGLLTQSIREQVSLEFKTRNEQLHQELNAKMLVLSDKMAQIKLKEEKIEELIKKGIVEKIKEEKPVLEKKIRSEIDKETSEQIEVYKEQLNVKTNQLIVLNKMKAQLERVQREKEELKAQMELEMEQRLTKELSAAIIKAKYEIEKNTLFKVEEKNILINSLKEQLKVAQRKMEQGSVQLQGEAQEKVIEDYLHKCFVGDKIEEIKKGTKGGDCIHHVLNTNGEECGSVYYESKRSSRGFQAEWINKFKQDMRQSKTTFGVIVTEMYPADMTKMGFKNGIIICSWEEFKGLSFILRHMIIALHQIHMTNQNATDKMAMLYQYLVSSEFHRNLEAIVEGFVQMSQDLSKERRSMESLWKQREKQIQKVMQSTSHMYASIKGIAGSAVNSIKELELNSNPGKLLTSKEENEK